jgi:hypothetical protein
MAIFGFETFANFRLENYGGMRRFRYVFVYFLRLRQPRPVSSEWPVLTI